MKTKECHRCKKEAVLQSGKGHCEDHSYLIDTPAIREMLICNQPNLTDLFFIHCFNTVSPTFSMFSLLYEKFPTANRGKWLGIKKGFEKSQSQYLNECFKQWLRSKLNEN